MIDLDLYLARFLGGAVLTRWPTEADAVCPFTIVLLGAALAPFCFDHEFARRLGLCIRLECEEGAQKLR